MVAQLPSEQKVVAVMQSGENEAALLQELDEDLQEKYGAFKKQVEAQRRQAQAEAAARQQMARGTAASNAFDVMRRRQVLEQRQRQASAEAEGTEETSGAAAATASAPARPPKAGPSDLGPEFSAAGRNDPCPCGSGKKFKKCHGK